MHVDVDIEIGFGVDVVVDVDADVQVHADVDVDVDAGMWMSLYQCIFRSRCACGHVHMFFLIDLCQSQHGRTNLSCTFFEKDTFLKSKDVPLCLVLFIETLSASRSTLILPLSRRSSHVVLRCLCCAALCQFGACAWAGLHSAAVSDVHNNWRCGRPQCDQEQCKQPLPWRTLVSAT